MKTTRMGWVIIIVCIIIPFASFFPLVKSNEPILLADSNMLVFISAMMLSILILFYRLRVRVNSDYLYIVLGIGIFRKKIALNSIVSARPFTCKLWYGWGIRFLPHATVYNVHGISAVEIRIKDKDRSVIVGVKNPDDLCNYINANINNNLNLNTESSVSSVKPAAMKFIYSLILILTVIPLLLVFYLGIREPRVRLNEASIELKGLYGFKYTFDEISLLDTVSVLPPIIMRTNGFSFNNNLKGKFRLKNIGHARMFVKSGHTPYIIVITNRNEYLLFNFSDNQMTRDFYIKLRDKIGGFIWL